MASNMKAVVKASAVPGADITSVEVPAVKSGHVLVRVRAAAICGTDLHIYDWNEWAQHRISPPMVIGHEFCGEVVEIGEGVTQVRRGDLIAGETHVPCGECYQCKTGLQHVCRNMKILGVDVPGVFSEYALIPEVCAWKIRPDTDPIVGAVLEPFGVAVHAVLSEDVAGKVVGVFGCGPIGLFAVSVARACGASKVIACEVIPERLQMAHAMGATHLVNPQEDDVVEHILDITHGNGLDVGVELSGASSALNQTLAAMTRGGRVSIAGLQPKPPEIDIVNNVVYKELRIYGITGRVMFGTWYKASALIESGAVELYHAIAGEYSLSEFQKAMTIAHSGVAGKLILVP
jgi:threonine 3-dehydrogenase